MKTSFVLSQRPVQFVQKMYDLNICGTAADADSAGSVNLHYRQHFTGITYAPVSALVSAQTARQKHSVSGLLLSRESAGPLTELRLAARITFLIRTGRNSGLGITISPGVRQVFIDRELLKASAPDEISQLSTAIEQSLNAGISVCFIAKRVRAFAAFEHLENGIQILQSSDQQSPRVAVLPALYGGLQFRSGSKLSKRRLMLFTAARVIAGGSVLPEAYAALLLTGAEFGTGFLYPSTLYATLGARITSHLRFRYSYSHNTATVPYFASGHELGLGFIITRRPSASHQQDDLLSQDLDENKLRVLNMQRQIDSANALLKRLNGELAGLREKQVSTDTLRKLLEIISFPSTTGSQKASQPSLQDSTVAKGSNEMIFESGRKPTDTGAVQKAKKLHIVMGVYEDPVAAIRYQHLLIKGHQYKTVLRTAGPDMRFYYVCLSPAYTETEAALKALFELRAALTLLKEPLTNGMPWILKLND